MGIFERPTFEDSESPTFTAHVFQNSELIFTREGCTEKPQLHHDNGYLYIEFPATEDEAEAFVSGYGLAITYAPED